MEFQPTTAVGFSQPDIINALSANENDCRTLGKLPRVSGAVRVPGSGVGKRSKYPELRNEPVSVPSDLVFKERACQRWNLCYVKRLSTMFVFSSPTYAQLHLCFLVWLMGVSMKSGGETGPTTVVRREPDNMVGESEVFMYLSPTSSRCPQFGFKGNARHQSPRNQVKRSQF